MHKHEATDIQMMKVHVATVSTDLSLDMLGRVLDGIEGALALCGARRVWIDPAATPFAIMAEVPDRRAFRLHECQLD